eukprot:6829313-Prymnesium_polylepis.5
MGKTHCRAVFFRKSLTGTPRKAKWPVYRLSLAVTSEDSVPSNGKASSVESVYSESPAELLPEARLDDSLPKKLEARLEKRGIEDSLESCAAGCFGANNARGRARTEERLTRNMQLLLLLLPASRENETNSGQRHKLRYKATRLLSEQPQIVGISLRHGPC